MNKYYCNPCAYIYNPEENNGIMFKELEGDYMCPVCGVGKDEFEIIHKKGDEEYQGEAQEKHIPIIEILKNEIKAKIGSIPHPISENHYIEFIKLYNDGELIESKELSHEDTPNVIFKKPNYIEDLKVVSKCNIHGLWESK